MKIYCQSVIYAEREGGRVCLREREREREE